VPHDPQFELSVAKFAQYAVAPVPHWLSPLPHVVPHTPAEHIWPAAHVVPHAPQFALSVMKFAQYAVVPAPHRFKPDPHVAPHAPAEHI
jgi:hypothetical protein